MKIQLTAQPSPITTEKVALSGKTFGELSAPFNDETLLLKCGDPENKGKSHVEALLADNSSSIRTTPLSANVRSAVHEYGGGSYVGIQIDANHKYIIYTDFPQHTLCAVPFKEHAIVSDDDEVIPIFPPNNSGTSHLRFADFDYDAKRHRLICVMEDHSHPKPSEVVNKIVSLSLHALLVHAGLNDDQDLQEHPKLMEILAEGNDFYASPKLSPDGTALAFVTWNHPHMPWFVTELCIQPLHPDGYVHLEELVVVHGNKSLADDDKNAVSVCDPRWDPHQHKLYFVSDATQTDGYYNLHVWDGVQVACLLETAADFTDGKFGWMLGTSPFVVQQNGTLWAIKGGSTLIRLVPTEDGYSMTEYGSDVIPPSSINSLALMKDSELYFLGGSALEPVSIWKWTLPPTDDDSAVEPATKVLSSIDPTKVDWAEFTPFFSVPQKISFPNRRNTVSHAYFYPPNNTTSSSSVKPPLLVKAHGGPTAQTSTTFRLALQYWTSRGFAILDVDYGGSLGYGRKYRLDLNGQWGIVDVQDVCDGAQYCVDQGWVDPKALCIDGGSAGGYTTLAALTFENTFHVGASLYGISDLSALAAETHKFESRYCDMLIGTDPKVFEERSPIRHCDQLDCPVVLLQGLEDKVVPPNQAEMMYDALKEKNIPSSLVYYEGEQHGFRMSHNIRHALHSEYSFFYQILGYEVQAEEGLSDIEIGSKVTL